MDISKQYKLKVYNEQPVYYCRQCLSLRIMGLPNMNYCDSCGSTDVDSCNISMWENMYESKHGIKYLNN